MKIIAHRKNTVDELKATPNKYGIEIDIRNYGDELILQHEPYISGERLETWLKEYNHGPLILNVKTDGLEGKLIKLMDDYGINDYFLLDQAFPALVKLANNGEKSCAMRVSEYESIETVLKLSGIITWVWVDYFTKFPLDSSDLDKLQSANFKLCIVSPELQGFNANIEIRKLKSILKNLGFNFDAVCTKHPDLWEDMC